MRKTADLKYGKGEKDFFDLLLPDGETEDLVIWFHGGGLVNLTRASIKFAEDLTQAGVGVASVEYRMYTHGAHFPDFLVDCADAVKFLQDNIKTYADPRRIFISGQSAGAYITLMLAFDKTYLDNAGVDRSAIAGFISDSAQTTTHFNVLKERGVYPRLERIDDAAPLYHISNTTELNSLLLIYYSQDVVCRPEQNKLLYQSLHKLCPELNVQITELPGKHTYGSEHRNERGTFDFNDTVLAFLNSIP